MLIIRIAGSGHSYDESRKPSHFLSCEIRSVDPRQKPLCERTTLLPRLLRQNGAFRRCFAVNKRIRTSTMLSLRWKGALLASLHLVLWFQAAAQPTPPPTLFAGSDYDYAQCLFDVFSADANGDGFISNTNEEYLTLFNNIGASFCFEQTTPLTATQQSAYFTLVCDLVPNCLITSEIPTSGLNQEQIIMICEETRARIFTTCDEPTASPTIAMPSVPSTPAPSVSQDVHLLHNTML